MSAFQIIDVTPGNVGQETLFCIRDLKNPGFHNKKLWFADRYKEGLKLKIIKQEGKMIAFIEYLPAEFAWRPVHAPGYMFIHCMYVYAKKDHNQGYGSELLKLCEGDTLSSGMSGMTAMTSNGSWIFDNRLFLKNGFSEVDKRDRFELMAKKLKANTPDPCLIDWTVEQKKYSGWHLIYADQCPWHEKSVNDLSKTAKEFGLNMNVHQLTTAAESRKAPSGFGVFSLVYNGKLLADHYISKTRFVNILKKELNLT